MWVRRGCTSAALALARGRRGAARFVVSIEDTVTGGTASPLPTYVVAVIVRVDHNHAVADAAPRNCRANTIFILSAPRS
jgi:hypothetical protein